MAILDNYASDFVGSATLPRPGSVFTPAAFAQATSIADRARLASANLAQSLELAQQESQMRDYILKGQEQDEQARKLAMAAELRAMQPSLKKELATIDPADDDAFDKLVGMEQYVESPMDRRRVTSLRSAADIVRREKTALIEQMQQSGQPLATIEAKLKEAKDQFKGGDSTAFRKAMTGYVTPPGQTRDRLFTEQSSLLEALSKAGVSQQDADQRMARAKAAFDAGDTLAYRKEAFGMDASAKAQEDEYDAQISAIKALRSTGASAEDIKNTLALAGESYQAGDKTAYQMAAAGRPPLSQTNREQRLRDRERKELAETLRKANVPEQEVLGKIAEADAKYDGGQTLAYITSAPDTAPKPSTAAAKQESLIHRERVAMVQDLQRGQLPAEDIEKRIKEADDNYKAGDDLAYAKADSGVVPPARRPTSRTGNDAANIARQQQALVKRLSQGGYPVEEIKKVVQQADAEYSAGQPLAYALAGADAPSFNEMEALRAEKARPLKEATERHTKALDQLSAAGMGRDITTAETRIKKNLADLKLHRPNLDIDRFLEFPQSALIDAPYVPRYASKEDEDNDAAKEMPKQVAALETKLISYAAALQEAKDAEVDLLRRKADAEDQKAAAAPKPASSASGGTKAVAPNAVNAYLTPILQGLLPQK